MLETIDGHLYDYPKYYDAVFGSDWKAERDFLLECFRRHARRKVRRLFEPACGTGRLLVKMADAGFEVAGNDLNRRAIDYCNARLERKGYPSTAVVSDMADFRLRCKVDAMFNTINSFRHLESQPAAVAHLRCVAEALHKGGIYVLGLHLTPTKGQPLEEESWSARRGNLAVLSHMKTQSRDLRRRMETVAMRFDVYTPSRSFRLQDTLTFRTYTAPQMVQLLSKIDTLQVVATYDFAYDIEQPVRVDRRTEDVVYVLRKLGSPNGM